MRSSMSKFEQHLKSLILENGPMDVGTFMNLAVGHYYSTRDPFGAQGDFTTAPEISQMFGEMIGVFLADAWIKMGSPAPVLLAEAGPGRGTLMADIMRATKNIPGFHDAAKIHFIEMSPVLKEKQKSTLGQGATWHESIHTLPDGPVLFVANEFLDALPIRQLQYVDGQWHERVIGLDGDAFVFGVGAPCKGPVVVPGDNDVFEIAPAREQFVIDIAARLKSGKGVALFIDYGHDHTACGDTLQAVRGHKYVDVLSDVGESDLTSHVDFETLKNAGSRCVVYGPVGQGDFLKAMGIELRALRLGKREDCNRLVADDQMGTLFRVMALCDDPDIKLVGFEG